jgi:hypothetical protein
MMLLPETIPLRHALTMDGRSTPICVFHANVSSDAGHTRQRTWTVWRQVPVTVLCLEGAHGLIDLLRLCGYGLDSVFFSLMHPKNWLIHTPHALLARFIQKAMSLDGSLSITPLCGACLCRSCALSGSLGTATQ